MKIKVSPYFTSSSLALVLLTSLSPRAALALPGGYEDWERCKKRDHLWNELILPSSYSAFEPVVAANPGLPFFNMSFTMDNRSDELPVSRPKAIHRSGSVAQVAFVSEPGSPLTGLWKGSDCGLVRLSLATKQEDTTVPGAAFKMFVDGAPSENFVAMHDLDGQSDYNFFAKTFSNVIAPPKSFLLKIIAKAFERASPFPAGVYLQDISAVQQNGAGESAPVFPYRIFLDANPTFASFQNAAHDFRSDLATIPEGTLLYTVHAVIPENPSDDDAANIWSSVSSDAYRAKAVKVGSFVTVSKFVASRWADEKLFFKHQRFANKK